MKKYLLSSVFVLLSISFGNANIVVSDGISFPDEGRLVQEQEQPNEEANDEASSEESIVVEEEVVTEDEATPVVEEAMVENKMEEDMSAEEAAVESQSFHQVIKQRFLEGGAGFMGIVLLCLILGLAIAIERILFLNLSSINTDKFIDTVEDALKEGGIESAKELCRNTKGPIASIFYQGLERADESVEAAEKAVIGYGGVQMGLLEKNVSWVSLFIAIAPMLGFMGTVIGMIRAFDKISIMGGLEASAIAGDIKVALLTTVFGLIVAIILQIFYNYIIAKIDNIVNSMEDASISLIDLLVENKK